MKTNEVATCEPAIEDRLVDTKEAARILGIAPNTLAKARVYKGPFCIPHVKIGRRVLYSSKTLMAHVRGLTFHTTAEHYQLRR